MVIWPTALDDDDDDDATSGGGGCQQRGSGTCPSLHLQLTPFDDVDDVIVDRGEGRPIN
jgi:hypothetical protein